MPPGWLQLSRLPEAISLIADDAAAFADRPLRHFRAVLAAIFLRFHCIYAIFNNYISIADIFIVAVFSIAGQVSDLHCRHACRDFQLPFSFADIYAIDCFRCLDIFAG